MDECCVEDDQFEVDEIVVICEGSGWIGFYIGGIVFKKQCDVDLVQYGKSVCIVMYYMDVVVIFGVVIGYVVDVGKIDMFCVYCGDMVFGFVFGIIFENVV